ncbi:CCGSCS motif protein [Marinobacter sp.]|uniref:CCGSCS motif protein n=1 Tax=Marinobacter sp. TaxID=50741 RepID=UPI003A8EF948
MALSFLNIFKKDDTEEEPKRAEEADSNKNAKASPDDSPKKGNHGEGTCCGSCS